MAFLFDIKRYSINDGPGVRITLFFKGCPLSCRWCHNPEGIAPRTEKLYNKNRCIGCGSCVAACPDDALTLTATEGVITDFSRCTRCGECAVACPTKAMEMSGRDIPQEEIMQIIRKETDIMDQSGGGGTFSGGEPLIYPEALKSLLVSCGEEGIHRAVDTSGHVRQSVVQEIMPHTDLFLYDLKMMDSSRHRVWTGVGNEQIIRNLKLIASSDKAYHIRIPLIEGVNCDEENIEATLSFLGGLQQKPSQVGLLPYHNIAVKKYEKLGGSYNEKGMKEPSKERVETILSHFRDKGFTTVIGG